MIALIQRVDESLVYIDDKLKSHIKKGLLVFLGIELDDNFQDADYLLEKVINLRVFEDHLGKMNLSVIDMAGELLIVSQFTLLADCKKGRRPSFTRAEQPQRARILYDYFIEKGKQCYGKISCGEFQAMMKIHIINDGPVTISINSRE
jgi:D-aminoacyl-tRNA deacylase